MEKYLVWVMISVGKTLVGPPNKLNEADAPIRKSSAFGKAKMVIFICECECVYLKSSKVV